LPVNVGTIELVDSGASLVLVVHGDEGVPLLGDVDIGDGSVLGELVLQDVLGAGPVDTVDKDFRATGHG